MAKRRASSFGDLWSAVHAEFTRLGTWFESKPSAGTHMKVVPVDTNVHYEWRVKDGSIRVCLHFEREQSENERWLAVLAPHRPTIFEGFVTDDCFLGLWSDRGDNRWGEVSYRTPLDDDDIGGAARRAAGLMKTLTDRTWPLIEPYVHGRPLPE